MPAAVEIIKIIPEYTGSLGAFLESNVEHCSTCPPGRKSYRNW